MESTMPSPSLLKMLSLFVKLASEVLKLGIVDENEYEDNHEKYVARQRQLDILRKI